MRQFNKFKGTKGFISTWNRVIRFRYMITEEAKRRTRILAFWERHGLGATKEAFNTSRATLFRWQKKLLQGRGKLESINPISTAPKKRRTRVVPFGVEEYIIRERTEHPRLSKEKLAVMMRTDLHIHLSYSTVGRIMNQMKKRNVLPLYKPKKRLSLNRKKKLRRNGFLPEKSGDLLEIDTVVTHIHGIKFYTLTAIDIHGRFAYAHTYRTASSKTAMEFLKYLIHIAPFQISHIQTDNGSEFAKYFSSYLEDQNIIHFHTYPRSPKMNAHIERFNRTIQEEFMDYKSGLLSVSIDTFNQKLTEWVVWYNEKRPHISLGYLSPLSYIRKQLAEKSHM